MTYDVIIVGAGHAGIEAALASARMNCRTLLITMNLDSIGQMSCNPSIGGLGKGHLVKEVDALGGEMGKATDESGIQFRMLNMRKGPAVQAPRAQCDKKQYQFRMKRVAEEQNHLDLRQAKITALGRENDVWKISTNLHLEFACKVLVLTTGTFLQGLMHLGKTKVGGGRMGDAASNELSDSLRSLGLELARLKTGTPPRLRKRSIHWERCEIQAGDTPIPFFSSSTDPAFHVEQLPCYLTYTTATTSHVIRENLALSPMYSGEIIGIGPRYCPSIEDKIVRFGHKERHQIFLEPEGRSTEEIYVNGASTSMPYEVQEKIIHSIIGLEEAELVRPAYAVEYDFVPPTQLHAWLECKNLANLFLAGQINGTSGYEEAACQGLIAGINAALRVKSQPPFSLGRQESYIGVLIDDLITQGAPEPYRMFTSRAEHRLLLRQDNADLRLSKYAHQFGLISSPSYQRVLKKIAAIDSGIKSLKTTFSGGKSLADRLRNPEVNIEDLDTGNLWGDTDVAQQIETSIKYDGYVLRQQQEIARFAGLEETVIPISLDYDSIKGLRTEARQKLTKIRPYTIGQAARVAGVTPSDVAVLTIWLRR